MLQPQGPNPYGVFLTHPREALDCHYERKLFWIASGALTDQSTPPAGAVLAADPRVTHVLTLEVDAFANVLQSVSVAYGRRFLDPSLSPIDQAAQGTVLITASESSFTNPILTDDANRTPMPAQASVYELLQCAPAADAPNFTNLFGFDEMLSMVAAAGDGTHDIPFENLDPSGLNPGQPYRRLISRTRSLYRPDDLGQAAGNVQALAASRDCRVAGAARSALPPGFDARPHATGLHAQRGGVAADARRPCWPALRRTAADIVDLDGDGNWWIPSNRVFYCACRWHAGARGCSRGNEFLSAAALRRFLRQRHCADLRLAQPSGDAIHRPDAATSLPL